jgi:hypothetical protein
MRVRTKASVTDYTDSITLLYKVYNISVLLQITASAIHQGNRHWSWLGVAMHRMR